MIWRCGVLLTILAATTIAFKLPSGGNEYGDESKASFSESPCDNFKCNSDSTCFEVGDSDCNSADCPKQPRCVLNGQITCANVRCDGPCVMILQATSYGGAGTAVPQCFPAEDDNTDTDDNTKDVSTCDNFKCQDDSKCVEVGDFPCNTVDCPKKPRCILKGQITCESIRCEGTCLMIHEEHGRKGTPIPFCLTEKLAVYGGKANDPSGSCQPGISPPAALKACNLFCVMGKHCVVDPVKGPQCVNICSNSPPVFPAQTCATKTRKCGCKEKCMMVNDPPCEGLKCSQHPQCFDKNQFTCASIKCPDKCVMELEVKGNGRCNPVPKCVTSDDSSSKPDDKYSEGDDGSDSGDSYKLKKKL